MKRRGLRAPVKNPPVEVLSCRCGHFLANHDRRGWCDSCKCTIPSPDMATYPLSQGAVTS